MNVIYVRNLILVVMPLLLLGSKSSYAQTKANCEVLYFILKNKEIESAFFRGIQADEKVVVIDRTKNNWEQCIIELNSDRKLEFRTDTLLTAQAGILHIVLYELKRFGRRYKAQMLQKETNAYARVEIKKNRKEMRVVSIEVSYF